MARARLIVLILLLTSIVWGPAIVYLQNHYRWTYQGHRYEEIDLKELSNFELNPVNFQLADIPARFRALDGQRVVASGYMWMPQIPDFPRVSFFRIVHSNSPRFLGSPVRPQAFVNCAMPTGKLIQFAPNRSTRVWGTMHVQISADSTDTALKSIYQIDVDKVDTIDAP